MNKLLKYTMFLLMSAFAACSSDDDTVPTLPTVQPQPGGILEVTVSAGDFVTDGAPDTRATDNGRTTTFENDDRVGIIILDESNEPIYNNIPYKYDSSSQTWSFDSDNSDGKDICYYDSNARTYIVYYPYHRDADGCKSESDLKERFKPQTNQSTKSGYRASDLMVWSTTTSNALKSLKAELTHAYASVSLSPIAKYLLDDGKETPCFSSSLKISDVNFTINDAFYVPYQATDGSLRCIIPADITPSGIRCFYTIGNKTYGNTINLQGAVAPNTRYNSAPEIINKTYSLADARVGDYYCKKNEEEGYLIPGDVASLENDQQTACIGVVFWVGDATLQDKTLLEHHDKTTHGLVVALRDALLGTTVWQNWWGTYDSVQSWLNSKMMNNYLSVASSDNREASLNNIQGYNNTKAIEEFNADINNQHKVRAVTHVVNYRNQVSAPTNSSGWYLPSEKELTLLCGKDVDDIGQNNSGGTDNRTLINSKLHLLNIVAKEIQSVYYWSSTEGLMDTVDDGLAFSVTFANGLISYYDKNLSSCRVRCVLAF